MKKILYIALLSICCFSVSWAEPVLIANPSISSNEVKRSDVAKTLDLCG